MMKSAFIFLSPLLAIGCATTGSSSSSGRSLADERMKAETQEMLDKIERAYALNAPLTLDGKGASAERGAKVQGRKVIAPPNGDGVWVEEWKVARDGGHALYTVGYVPTPAAGGSEVSIKMPPEVVVP